MTDRQAHSVQEVAQLLGIRQHGVLSLIRSGELVAVDVSLKRGGRPRWRIMDDDLQGFIARRTFQKPVRKTRQRNATDVREYF